MESFSRSKPYSVDDNEKFLEDRFLCRLGMSEVLKSIDIEFDILKKIYR